MPTTIRRGNYKKNINDGDASVVMTTDCASWNGSAYVVPSGNLTYVNVEVRNGRFVSFSGPTTLRKFANAILAALDEN